MDRPTLNEVRRLLEGRLLDGCTVREACIDDSPSLQVQRGEVLVDIDVMLMGDALRAVVALTPIAGPSSRLSTHDSVEAALPELSRLLMGWLPPRQLTLVGGGD